MQPIDTQSPILTSYLATHDEPCPSCSYNLRNLTTDRCPECNQRLTLRVGLAEPRLGAYLAALAGFAAGWGAAAVFLSVFLFFTLREGLPPPGKRLGIYGIPSIAFLLLGVSALALARQRGRAAFRKSSAAARAALILAAWIAPAAFVVWFILALV